MSDQESINILNSLIPPINLNSTSTTTSSGQLAQEKPLTNGIVNHHEEQNGGDVTPTPSLTNGHNGGGIGGCPFFTKQSSGRKPYAVTRSVEWQTSTSVANQDVPYDDYLHLDRVLNAQKPLSAKYGKLVHDEHLFIVVHQAYELWFKQILFELDSIAILLGKPIVDESNLLVIVSRIQRINMIWKLLNDQIAILETMAPTDFIDFRGYLTTASGFQSLQFRLVENRLGLAEALRFKFNQLPYDYPFTDEESRTALKRSLDEPSMLKLIEAWLERTPGLVHYEQNESTGARVEYNYWLKEYEKSVHRYLNDTFVTPAMEETEESQRQSLVDEYRKTLDSFNTLFEKEKHDKLVERGERKLSHKALWGALMIWLNRDEPRFHLPYQLLLLLTDMDALINRWRYNHALLAQRQVGNKSGTGGSSGYSYLRSTASDRYKMFNDIVNLSTWLIPRAYVPKLNDDIRKRLNSFNE